MISSAVLTTLSYALHLVDTVKVNKEKAVCLTEGTKSTKECMFYLSHEEERAGKPSGVRENGRAPNGKASPVANKIAGSKVLRNKTRGAANEDIAMSTSAKIAGHQKSLHAQLQEEGMKKYADGGKGARGKEGKSWKRFASYKGDAGLPNEVESLRIFVDKKNQTIVFPIYGYATPFHINTVKNASKSDEGEWTLLRINFQTPGQLAGKKEDTVR